MAPLLTPRPQAFGLQSGHHLICESRFVLAGNQISDAVRAIATGTDFELSSFERLIDFVPVRSKIGIEIGKKTIKSKKPKEWLLQILSEMVEAIATKKFEGEKFVVGDIYSAEKAAAFADKVLKKVGTTVKRAAEWTVNEDNSVQIPAAKVAPRVRPPKPVHPIASWARNSLIPQDYPRAKFHHAKLNNIYRELKLIDPHHLPIATAITFRALLEVTLKLYCNDNSIVISGKDTVINRAKTALAWMRKNKKIEDDVAKKIQAKLDGQPLAITTELNDYVHHKDFHPDGRTLNTAWDNLQAFFDVLWADFK